MGIKFERKRKNALTILDILLDVRKVEIGGHIWRLSKDNEMYVKAVKIDGEESHIWVPVDMSIKVFLDICDELEGAEYE